ncbi:endoglucanase E-4-like [Glandiceps talaboti]
MRLLICLALVVGRVSPIYCDHLFDQIEAADGVEWPWGERLDTAERLSRSDAVESSNQAKLVQKRSTSHYEYSEALHLSLLFYEAQRSGVLPEDKRVPWRFDSAVDDQGSNRREDLSGGWYDAGDHVKFGLPMAYSATVLGWGLLEYRESYEVAGLMDYMRNSLKWAYDYFMKCHAKKNKFFYQVGNGNIDHKYWIRPENMTMERPAYYVDNNTPGSDVLGETTAALATCYIIFQEVDPAYASNCLVEAKDLYRMAKNWRGVYPPDSYYKSSGYSDELIWAAAWLYRATNDSKYLTEAEDFYSEFKGGAKSFGFSWDDKKAGLQVLLYELTGKEEYAITAQRNLDKWLPDGTVTYTPKGLAWVFHWGSLRYTAATAFLALVAADHGLKSETYRDFAVNQIHYILGDAGHSYVVGFGHHPPRRPHHRGSSCPDIGVECKNRNSLIYDGPNHHVLYGAMVGGPDNDDQWEDNRQNYFQNEVACDYNAGFQSAVAGLKHLELNGML